MMKYKGNEIVEVYSIEAPFVPGGTMVGNGNMLGVFRQPKELFFFNKNNKSYRVTNVTKSGKYVMKNLRGI